MKSFLVLLLAAMTAWVAVTANDMDNAHLAAGRPKKARVVAAENPATQKLQELANDYGTRQVLFACVGVAVGLFLALTVALKILKLLAIGCVVVLALVLWQAWERGYITASRAAPTTAQYSAHLA